MVLGVAIVGKFSGSKAIGTWVCISDRRVWFLARVRVRSSRGLCYDQFRLCKDEGGG